MESVAEGFSSPERGSVKGNVVSNIFHIGRPQTLTCLPQRPKIAGVGELMKCMLSGIQATRRDKRLGVIRIFLGFMFLSTGSMKLLVPLLWTAWSGQLTAAQIPFYRFNLWFVPIAEILIGLLFLFGWMSRLAGVVAIAMMGVATYVHLVVGDPTLFPLQPTEPFIPIVVIAMAAYVLWRGSGAWSLDVKAVDRSEKP